ncbi:MAG: hypothetical protein ABI831_10650 [Betaproteobacteria bacterium]|jgi:N-acyl-D-aspartate/D-glutamate deacylase
MKEQFDLLIRNATIIDGSGAARFDGDIGVRGDRIASIGRLDAAGATSKWARPEKSPRRASSTRIPTTTG